MNLVKKVKIMEKSLKAQVIEIIEKYGSHAVSVETGLKYSWLNAVRSGAIKNPGIEQCELVLNLEKDT